MSNQLLDMCFVTPELLQCIGKLSIDLHDKGNGQYELDIDWDKDDESLKPWMDLSEQEQTDFILACLNSQVVIEAEDDDELAQVTE